MMDSLVATYEDQYSLQNRRKNREIRIEDTKVFVSNFNLTTSLFVNNLLI